MKKQFIVVSYAEEVKKVYLKSLSGSMKDSITKYLTNYLLVDNYSEDEFNEALYLYFFDDHDITIEEI